MFQPFFKGKHGWRGRQSGGFEQGGEPRGICGGGFAQLFGQTRRQHAAGGDGFSMQPSAVTHLGFNGVSEGVSEVEPCAYALFGFVLGDDVCLHLAAAVHGLGEFFPIERHQFGHMLFQPFKKADVAERAVFDDFRHTGGQFAGGQGVQRVQVGKHRLRLVKRANHIFAERVVDGGFAAHR
ncbi:Uncharacterised protein [Neisseria meningitidis]|nr:Uncharacterised protein [Neisseria meningitidis]CWQ64571.1 Uncharacterised protein [Neisseria meningitidis]CWQ91087.1 Uncharacterised protein [Neisseria meningitidis]